LRAAGTRAGGLDYTAVAMAVRDAALRQMMKHLESKCEK
jgi:hypothetical protein